MPKISDVARAAGVSQATVSRVLNHPEMVAADKRNRVHEAMARLDYRPNLVARNLARGHYDTLALVVGDIAQPFHATLAKAVEAAAEEYGYSVVLCDLDHRQDRLVQFLADLPSRGVDGAIVATADNLDTAPVREAIDVALGQGFVLVTTALPLEGLNVPAIVNDHEAACEQATRHLLEQGRWPLAFLGGTRTSVISAALRRGFRSACRGAGLRLDRKWLLSGDFVQHRAHRVLGNLLDSGTDVQGVVAASTPMALGAMRSLAEHGRAVPADTAIVSCEDVPLAEYLSPGLTSIRLDLDDIGRRAVGTLAAAVAGRTVPRLTEVPYELVIRGSSGG